MVAETFTALREEFNRPSGENTTLNKLSREMIPLMDVIQKTFGEFMDVVVENTTGKIYHRDPVFQEMYVLNWDEMDDYLPKVLGWFVTIFRKVIKLDSEGSIFAPKALISLQLTWMLMFSGNLILSVVV